MEYLGKALDIEDFVSSSEKAYLPTTWNYNTFVLSRFTLSFVLSKRKLGWWNPIFRFFKHFRSVAFKGTWLYYKRNLCQALHFYLKFALGRNLSISIE